MRARIGVMNAWQCSRLRRAGRRGNIVVLTAVLMVVMLGMIAFAVDVGYMYTLQTQLARSVDAAALAGAGVLVDGQSAAEAEAVEFLVRNPVGTSLTAVDESQLESAKVAFLTEHGQHLTLAAGEWNASTRKFEPGGNAPSTMQVALTYPHQPLFFGRLLGRDDFTIHAESVAMYQPRDIVVVLDFSGSMNDDSTFAAWNSLGKTAVDANQLQIYQDLGSPVYGNMQFEPDWCTVPGVPPANSTLPQINVQYRRTSVFVTSTKPLQQVKVEFTDGSSQTWSNLTASSGTYSSGSKQVNRVWVRSANNSTSGELFDFSSSAFNNTIKKGLGLTNVAWPYPGGSWDAYINYCKSSSGQNNTAGYRCKFGYKSLVNYWLDQQYGHTMTPDLWKVRAQPMHSVKEAVDVFMDFILEVPTGDRVGLAIYDGPDGNGLLEVPLTTDLDQIVDVVTHRQAGHYHNYTNIGAGMQTAREHLDQYGRQNAFKMVVLMTDGQANWHNGQYNEGAANNHVIQEANLAAAEARRYPIVAISLGAGADTSIMQNVASITKSKHFNVPGGRPIAEVAEDLENVFREIANHRPLKLVK
jgi:Flp pilus assembly protein TadG